MCLLPQRNAELDKTSVKPIVFLIQRSKREIPAGARKSHSKLVTHTKNVSVAQWFSQKSPGTKDLPPQTLVAQWFQVRKNTTLR